MRFFLPLLLATVGLSCNTFLINDNKFNVLSRQERSRFTPFVPEDAEKVISYRDSCPIQRINHQDITALSTRYRALVLVQFAPWCGGTTCEHIGKYQETVSAGGEGCRLVLMALSYQLPEIREKLRYSGINRMVYVMDTCYSRHYGKAGRQFFKALKKQSAYSKRMIPDWCVIRNDTVLYVRDWRLPEEDFIRVLKAAVNGEQIPVQTW